MCSELGEGGKIHDANGTMSDPSCIERIVSYAAIRCVARIGTYIASAIVVMFVASHFIDFHRMYLMYSAEYASEMRYRDEVCDDHAIMSKLRGKDHCSANAAYLTTDPIEKALYDKLTELSICGEQRCARAARVLDDNKYVFAVLGLAAAAMFVWIVAHRGACVYVARRYLPLDNPGAYMPLGPDQYSDPGDFGHRGRLFGGPRPSTSSSINVPRLRTHMLH